MHELRAARALVLKFGPEASIDETDVLLEMNRVPKSARPTSGDTSAG